MNDAIPEMLSGMVRVTHSFDGSIINPALCDLNFMAWNINHLTNKLHLVERYVAVFPRTLHIIAISETWLTETNKSTYNLRGYLATHNVRRNVSGGGISIFIHESICKIAPKVLFDVVTPDLNHFLVIEVPTVNATVAVPYRRPNKLDEQRRINTFISDFERYCLSSFNCMILGDFNLNQLDVNNHNRLIDLLEANGSALLNEISSRGITRQRSGTILDLCITNLLNVSHNLSLVHNAASDHGILFVSTSLMHRSAHSVNTKTKFNLNAAVSLMEQKFNNSTISCGNELNFALSDIVNECTSVIKVRSDHRIRNSHIDRELILAIRERDRLAALQKSMPSNDVIAQLLVEKTASINERNFQLKSSFESTRLAAAAGDDRKTWQLYKEIIFNQFKNKTDTSIEINGTAITDDVASCNIVNDFFCTAGEKLAASVIATHGYSTNDIDSLYPEFESNNWDFRPVDAEQVSEVIIYLPNKKTTSFDKVPIQLFKSSLAVIALTIASCFQTMISTSDYPCELLKGRLKLIHKSGSCDIDNFRGLTLLPSLSKIFEELLLRQLYEYLESLNFFVGNQFGFLKNSCCQSAALQLIDYIKSNCNNKFVAATFIDLKKAFDTVDVKRLVRKFKRLGLSTNACKLMKSYLENRHTATSIGDNVSNFKRVNIGVAQGSKLGPVHFIIYINDLLQEKFIGQLLLYADDAVLVYASDTPIDLQAAMQHDANLLNEWLGRNVLSLNKSKTCYMLFGRARNITDLTICFDGSSIDRVTRFKYLGLIIDEGLTFHEHVNHVKKKVAPFVSLMWRKSKYIPIEKRKQLYNAYVQSHLLYMLPIYSDCAQYKLDELQTLQNQCIKALYRLDRYTPTTLLYSTGLLPINELAKAERIIFVHKLSQSLTKNNFRFVTNAEVHGRSTRRNSRLHVFNHRTTGSIYNSCNAALSSAIDDYNQLDSLTRNIRCFKTFKAKVKLKTMQESQEFNVITPFRFLN